LSFARWQTLKTDHWFYGLFQSAPDLVALLLPQGGSVVPSLGPDAPGNALYRFDAPELKAASHRLDGAFWPRSADTGTAEQPVVLLEVQMHAKPGFKHRLGAQSFRFLQLHPQVEHLAVVVLVPHQRLNLGPARLPQQLQAFVDGVLWLSLEELGHQADLDPLLSLLTLPVRPEAELQASSQQILERRPDLLSAVQTILLERLPFLTREDFMEFATIPAKDLRHTRVAQEWIEEGGWKAGRRGGWKGCWKAKPRSLFACSTVAAAPSVTPLQPGSRRCRWSNWKPWPRQCSISAAPPTWPPGWPSTAADAQALAGLQVMRT
jgi:predicted transposase YdaD